jgi:hypothetical protein
MLGGQGILPPPESATAVTSGDWVGFAVSLSTSSSKQAQTSVTTYHGHVQRTGWNPYENLLAPSTVTPKTFGLIASVALDDQADAQQLVVANQNIAGMGSHTVVYVVTENNTIYAIDSPTGNILKNNYFESPVPTPLGCSNNGPTVGITSTPTIDLAKQVSYVMAYGLIAGQPTYRFHALDLQTLQDKIGCAIIVSASHTLTDGSQFTLNPQFSASTQPCWSPAGTYTLPLGVFVTSRQTMREAYAFLQRRPCSTTYFGSRV